MAKAPNQIEVWGNENHLRSSQESKLSSTVTSDNTTTTTTTSSSTDSDDDDDDMSDSSDATDDTTAATIASASDVESDIDQPINLSTPRRSNQSCDSPCDSPSISTPPQIINDIMSSIKRCSPESSNSNPFQTPPTKRRVTSEELLASRSSTTLSGSPFCMENGVADNILDRLCAVDDDCTGMLIVL